MIKEFNEFSTGALLKIGDSQLLQSYTKEKQLELYTFIWVRDHEITVSIDSIETTIAKDTIVVLTPNQFFIENSIALRIMTRKLVVWEFFFLGIAQFLLFN